MGRAVVDISTLDLLLRDEVDKLGSVAAFTVAVWRHEPDESGANWDARIRPISGNAGLDPRLKDVVLTLRAVFSLNGDD